MANILLTYDVSAKHSEVKDSLVQRGYVDRFKDSKGEFVFLPNTTMRKDGITTAAARDDMRAIATALGINLQRCFACGFDDWAAIYGDSHKS
jgi:hypothetical protein